MSAPGTYLDRGDSRLNSSYHFVSYSHKDKNEVFDILNAIYTNGVNYWYDTELQPGDPWNQRVEKIMASKHCTGAFVFLSGNALMSQAVNKEFDRLLSLHEENEDFRIITIILGFDTPKELYAEYEDNGVPDEVIDKFRAWTRKSIWLQADRAIDAITSQALKWGILEKHWTSLRDVCVSEMDSKIEKGKRYFIFGKYPFDIAGTQRDIEWELVCRKNEMLYLISRYCLDFLGVYDISACVRLLAEQLETEKGIKGVALPTEAFINEYKAELTTNIPTDYADNKRQQLLRLFWVQGEDEKTYYLYNSLNEKINKLINYETINAGIRPLLLIDNSEIGGNNNVTNQ